MTRLDHTRRLRNLTAVLIAALIAVPESVLACPSCKQALEGDPVGNALSWTTLFMIAVPFSLMVSIGGWISYVYWRAGRRSAESAWPLVLQEKESQT